MTNTTERRKYSFRKDPEEKWSIIVHFAKAFPSHASEITSATVTAQKWLKSTPDNKETTTDIFETDAFEILDTKKSIKVFHEAGTHNYVYKIRVKATLDNGDIVLVKTYYIRVKNA